jgi:hypothetical protein
VSRALRALVAGVLLLVLGACAAVIALPEGVDVLVVIGHRGADAWTVTRVEGGDLGDRSGDNPTLTLRVGERYRFEIPVSNGVHPFELLTLGHPPGDPRDPAGDVVLLSEEDGEDGSFEADADVDFVSDGDVFEFTLTQALADALTGYRCGVHTVSMWGAIEIGAP